MEETNMYLKQMLSDSVIKAVISKPVKNKMDNKRYVIEKKKEYYQIARYTEKQVFHENVKFEKLQERCREILSEGFLQVNAWDEEYEHMLLISSKGKLTYKKKKLSGAQALTSELHNRKKNYILEEGMIIPPLVDMGVFTKEGKIVNSMYDKYKQINRFIEIIDDGVKEYNKDVINIIDFGCGKSYLTFVVYHYLTQIKGIKANVIGLDLKADVIKKCNETAKKYNYEGLEFKLGDINGYKAPFDVNMVITLHACDTATDYALYNAVMWDADMIFSVPCCQHELNSQMKAERLDILAEYGIIKERFAALATDAVRGKTLEYCGYKTQLLEFVDFSHTPKNILIRAVKKKSLNPHSKKKALEQIENIKNEFDFEPTICNLLLKQEK